MLHLQNSSNTFKGLLTNVLAVNDAHDKIIEILYKSVSEWELTQEEYEEQAKQASKLVDAYNGLLSQIIGSVAIRSLKPTRNTK